MSFTAESEFVLGSDEELELFEDAQDEFIETSEQLVKRQTIFLQDVQDERVTLPYLRPPNMKVSMWALLKEFVGKDLTRISMPVYFNEPLSML